ncbi:MAG: tetratricopeptide repeat protein, partial [Pseudomonadales bacterium]|nr:tetratricopeptide repeat protein [Pseudomonadales bacterium]NIX06583.1 tetratricopeptide repeat protein [Pseudomonadales bacterium]
MSQIWSKGTALLGVAVLVGCAGPGGPPMYGLDYDPRLITGETVFAEGVNGSSLPPVNILEIDADMRAFVADAVGDVRNSSVKFKRLMRALVQAGYFNGSYYQPGLTLTASELFAAKTGNCLSYTTMFIALAREAGLNAGFQVVQVPPNWDADSGYLIRYTHISVLLSGVRGDVTDSGEVSVDFNAFHPDPHYPRHPVSDEDATALFYSNRSIDGMKKGDARNGFALLVKALELTPDNADLWQNLGAFYALQKQPEMAVRAYEVALSVDHHHEGALSGLARSYRLLGDRQQAEAYARRVHEDRSRNAYYHFAMAQAQFDKGLYDDALNSIDSAIDLERRNPRFRFMKGLVQVKLGDADGAKKSFLKAHRLGR